MFEVATTTAHREAIRRAHSERSAVFAAGFAWLREFISPRRTTGAAVGATS